jgi:glycosyltransferase involved in cell wall biosynthesis
MNTHEDMPNTMKSVAVITGATGSPMLLECCASVRAQTYPNIQHWVVVDGQKYEAAVRSLVTPKEVVFVLPENTGGDGYVCHRINGSLPWIINTDYVCFLDEDNAFEANHIEYLMASLSGKKRWAHGLRSIESMDGNYMCDDNCESLGGLSHTVLGFDDRLIDTNCYLMERTLAIQISPLWHVKARAKGAEEADRSVCRTLLALEPDHGVCRTPSVRYRVGNRSDSVQSTFFTDGNKKMELDFTKKDLYLFMCTPELNIQLRSSLYTQNT